MIGPYPGKRGENIRNIPYHTGKNQWLITEFHIIPLYDWPASWGGGENIRYIPPSHWQKSVINNWVSHNPPLWLARILRRRGKILELFFIPLVRFLENQWLITDFSHNPPLWLARILRRGGKYQIYSLSHWQKLLEK